MADTGDNAQKCSLFQRQDRNSIATCGRLPTPIGSVGMVDDGGDHAVRATHFQGRAGQMSTAPARARTQVLNKSIDRTGVNWTVLSTATNAIDRLV